MDKKTWTQQAKQQIIACLNSGRLSDEAIAQIFAVIMLNVKPSNRQAKAELVKLVR